MFYDTNFNIWWTDISICIIMYLEHDFSDMLSTIIKWNKSSTKLNIIHVYLLSQYSKLKKVTFIFKTWHFTWEYKFTNQYSHQNNNVWSHKISETYLLIIHICKLYIKVNDIKSTARKYRKYNDNVRLFAWLYWNCHNRSQKKIPCTVLEFIICRIQLIWNV